MQIQKTYNNIIKVDCKTVQVKKIQSSIKVCALTREFLPKNVPKEIFTAGVLVRRGASLKPKPPKIFIVVSEEPEIVGEPPYKCTITSRIKRELKSATIEKIKTTRSRKAIFVSDIQTTLSCVGREKWV